MMPHARRQIPLLVVLAVVSSIVLILGAGTAFAGEGRGKALGKGGQAAQSTVTEDNDSDEAPNTPDPSGDVDNQHPSGKDKHAEAGGSGNQGASTSTPDQDGRGPDRDEGGTDKPDGPGGADILDQDGNNGCGNDDDFDDDNEGLCGGPEVGGEAIAPPENGEAGEVGGVRTVTEEGPSVLGVRVEWKPSEEAEVLGARLARTGFDAFPFVVSGTALIVLGSAGVLRRRRIRMDRSS